MSADSGVRKKRSYVVLILRKTGILISLILLCVVLGIKSEEFRQISNILNVLRQVSYIAIIAVGMTFVILTAGIDLSVGSVLALSSYLMATILLKWKGQSGLLGMFMGISVCLLVGCSFGLINGLLVTKGKMHSFVATLGTMAIARSLTLVLSKGSPLSGFGHSFSFIGAGYVTFVGESAPLIERSLPSVAPYIKRGIPFPVILMFCIFALSFFVLRKTVFGRIVYAIGSNKDAAKVSGINTDLSETIVYVLSGLLAAVGGVIVTSRLDSAQPSAGEGYELLVIAAVVVGGTSLFGGEGGVIGTLLGALLMGVIRNGLNLLGSDPFWHGAVVGGVIILAVLVDRLTVGGEGT